MKVKWIVFHTEKVILMNKSRRRAVNIILVLNAILISLLEAYIPVPVPLPGVKLGMGNIVIIIAVVFMNLKDVFFIVIVRCFVVAVLSKGIIVLVFSLTGGILSAFLMWLLYKKLHNFFSIRGISIAGAIIHNIGQVLIASIILNESIVIYYLPILLISSIVTGFITGSIADIAICEIRKRGILSDKN